MEEAIVYSISLDISTAEFIELIQAFKLNGASEIKIKDGFMKVNYAKLWPPLIVGIDYQNNRVIRIDNIDGKIVACIIEDMPSL